MSQCVTLTFANFPDNSNPGNNTDSEKQHKKQGGTPRMRRTISPGQLVAMGSCFGLAGPD